MLINTSLAVDGDIDCRRTCSCPWSRPALLECWSTPLRFCILAAGPPSRCRISPWLLANTSVQMRKGVVCFHCSRETEAQWIQLTLNHTKKQNWIDSGCSESGTYFTPPPVPTPACVPSNGGGGCAWPTYSWSFSCDSLRSSPLAPTLLVICPGSRGTFRDANLSLTLWETESYGPNIE